MLIDGIGGTKASRLGGQQHLWQAQQLDDTQLQEQLAQQMAMLMQAMQMFVQALMQMLNQMSGNGSGQGDAHGVNGPGLADRPAKPGGQQATEAPPPGGDTFAAPPGGTPGPLPTSSPANGGRATDSSSGAASNGPPKPGGIPGITYNAAGVPKANPIDGVNPNAVQVLNTGTGTDKVYNVTNATHREQSFTYSTNGANKGTITLKPGETGAFVAGSADLGVRITPSDSNGNTHPNEILYEDGGSDNGQPGGVGNPDVSKVDGNKDFYGLPVNMVITLSNGRTAGDGEAIRPYLYPTDDAAAMGLAGDPSKTVSIVLSDA